MVVCCALRLHPPKLAALDILYALNVWICNRFVPAGGVTRIQTRTTAVHILAQCQGRSYILHRGLRAYHVLNLYYCS